MIIYPSWLYKKVDGQVVSMLAKNELEHKALGPEWVDTPATSDLPVEPAQKPARKKKEDANVNNGA